jgi:hypothetical protein
MRLIVVLGAIKHYLSDITKITAIQAAGMQAQITPKRSAKYQVQ